MPRIGPDEERTRQLRQHKQRQRDALRERILEVSRGIVRSEGLASLSMRKLADAIDYSPAALYLHFRSRGEIARALREEGHAQLRAAFAPHATLADPAARLRAMGRAYVEFSMAEPEMYRLMFMEPADAAGAADTAMLSVFADAFAALKAVAPLACAQALWANLHGIVALELTGATPPATPVAALVELSLDAWLAAGSGRAAGSGD
ncbi:TetR/AcrR family transcriptional regulator [Caballeronia sp. LZ016]|uniref:TetR/AcrR family transcriptional regulator n=1 Tax=Caballeronia sp. LZ016 TaxID=3038554 RepID=UPI00285E1869|nr:TetR/AcrR family transcriptional regulator [Caballeronia sp. LZ016]MDR5738512.1 TetR/AcrR family transcriptional regulator [Caballeronia sp. LZ016]